MASRILVILQVVLSASLVLTTRPGIQNASFLLLSAVGVAFGIWAVMTIGPRRVSVMPDVREETQLKTTGPYRLVRHPMYAALLLACLGLAFSPYRHWKLVMLIALALVLAAKAVIEEQQLRDRFDQYDAYAQQTKRLVPFIW